MGRMYKECSLNIYNVEVKTLIIKTPHTSFTETIFLLKMWKYNIHAPKEVS